MHTNKQTHPKPKLHHKELQQKTKRERVGEKGGDRGRERERERERERVGGRE